MKTLRIIAALLLLAGATLTARAVYMRAKAELAGILIRHAWEESVKTGQTHTPWSWADMHPIARLEIPRLNYDEIVLDAATPRALAFGPARLQSSAGFGESGNLVLAGHRTSWFRPLEGIKPGDEIRIEWFDPGYAGVYKKNYTVSMIRVVDPKDVRLLEPTSEDTLTLITCYPFGSSPRSPQRFIVRAAPSVERMSAQRSLQPRNSDRRNLASRSTINGCRPAARPSVPGPSATPETPALPNRVALQAE